MQNENRLKYINGYKEHYFFVDSSSLESDIQYIRSNSIGNLVLNGRDQYQLSDLDWLRDVGEQVKKLVITPPSKDMFCYKGLKFCVNLIKLKINNFPKDVVDLSNNINLIDLDLLNFKKSVGLDKLTKLKNLTLNNAPVELLSNDIFSKLKELNSLCIANTNMSKGVRFLKLSPLKYLNIFSCKQLSLNGLMDLKIESLSIERCKNIAEFENIYLAKNLKELSLIDSDKISHATQLDKLQNLKKLIVLGNTFFEDGDLSSLKNRFTVCNYDDKRHYNIKHKEFIDKHLLK